MQHLILDTNGLIVKKRNQCFWILSKKFKYRLISPKRLKSIAIVADVLMSTAATHLAVINKIPIYYADNNGQLYGTIRHKSFRVREDLRMRQTIWSMSDDARSWVLHLYQLKISQQFRFFDKSADHFIQQELDLNIQSDRFYDELRVIEAGVGKSYWKKYRERLPIPTEMKSRLVRPAEDRVNILLNYFYGFLYTLVEQAIWTNGLNPYIEVMHRQHHQKPVLAFDIIEPYRILVDDFVLELLYSGSAKSKYFISKSKGLVLSSEGKRALVPLFLTKTHEPVEIEGHTTSWHKHIYRRVYDLRKRIEQSKVYEKVFDYLRHREQ